ncbi:phosphatidylserine/phosphatidylglycerophosphate/cardiolipin synthase family protein [Georgenia sp. 311]|uniref:Phosphatidylserine/phosphatidylglycerophosphate/ cardiolipin synthase family protein n=1 Tax=Georgenia wutianyii TaxID=2585135 RepID=A0ABX5VPE9_9MICO|nr:MULTISPECIES: phospholipase D-like domain-containing protein [Georgenia]QDB78680.1 phosphatidylserine/phosphatidylglycerophosphate/cardiolipin synthase family protein [Georgenia wutianyii]TNC17468.1 phosphatidylserine/phosphatidylglycerophosphate/cardiolipin synthase family protein [Georgenia sp. 311]
MKLSTARRWLRPRVRRAVTWGALGLACAQVAAAATVWGVDSLRKRREPPGGEFPLTEPVPIDVAGSALTVYTYGEDVYAAMLEAIREAKHYVFFESYIWKDDPVGREFKRELIRAAERGVQVFVIFDSFGNLVVPRSFKRFPDSVHVMRFPLWRPGLITFNIRKSGRDHRKILVVDGERGFVGGYNIGQLYATSWRDTHLQVRGPQVWELDNAFVDFWNEHRRPHHPELEDRGALSWDARIQSTQNSPSSMLFPVRGAYIKAMDRAQHHIYITQGYFIPDTEFLGAMLRSARRGVDVRVLIPEVSNHVLADWAARTLYRRMLEGGVTIWLYQGAMVHAKTATVDGRWTTIGTTNIDRLSLVGNFEINLEIYDEAIARHMEKVFATDLTNARLLTLEEWESRPFLNRVGERLLHPLRFLF